MPVQDQKNPYLGGVQYNDRWITEELWTGRKGRKRKNQKKLPQGVFGNWGENVPRERKIQEKARMDPSGGGG